MIRERKLEWNEHVNRMDEGTVVCRRGNSSHGKSFLIRSKIRWGVRLLPWEYDKEIWRNDVLVIKNI